MTGTEKASLRAALGVLRRGILEQSECYPRGEWDAGAYEDIERSMAVEYRGLRGGPCRMALEVAADPDLSRILRARLALAIRAMLRAEVGDEGSIESAYRLRAGGWARYENHFPQRLGIVCPDCGEDTPGYDEETTITQDGKKLFYT
jgi:hypothetical protein